MRRLIPALGALVLLICALPQDAKAWWNSDWSYRKQITLDAGAGGGAIASDPGRIPVLIRLHDGNFKFTDAKDDGTDLRFIAEDDKTPLKYHIEKFDAVFNMAVIWVDLPALKAGSTTNIWMYYGNSKAVAADDPKGTYDTDQTLVYHFSTRDGPPHDVTAYANNATTMALVDEASLIGTGAKFDGTNSVTIPASPSLQIAAGGGFTWSAWIKPDPATRNAILYARHDGTAALLIGLADGAPYIAAGDSSVGLAKTDPATGLAPNAWHFLTVTAADKITLYVDGQPVKTLAATLPALNTPASVGADNSGQTATFMPDGAYSGEMDELDIAKVARTPGYILTRFASEGPDGKLTKYGQDEQTSAFSSGYFGVILRSVTLDGWVIISVLLVMAVISWMVMIDRGIYLTKVTRTNKRFEEAYRTAGQNLEKFEVLYLGDTLSENDRRQIERSPLFRVFQAGQEELQLRLDEHLESDDAGFALSSQTIQAMRASVDSVIVLETQKLNKLMILLTIAISGGPFIGLLGTVVGVMITFAAIAASGDVNVNSIAPGIAAALVATVAGLFVAIPALFGYNYFLSQIRDASAQINVFADKFITRIAELYATPRALRKIAAE